MVLAAPQTDTGTPCPDTKASAYLCVRGPCKEDRLFELCPGRTTIGSSPRCNLQLLESNVQPVHLLVVTSEDGVSVRRWAVGALINGSPFDEATLVPGDYLTIGSATLEFGFEAAGDDSCGSQHQAEAADGSTTGDSGCGNEPVDTTQEHDALAQESSCTEPETAHDAALNDSRHRNSASGTRNRKMLAAVRRTQVEGRRLSERIEVLEQLLGTIVDDWQVACQAAPPGGESAAATTLRPAISVDGTNGVLVEAAVEVPNPSLTTTAMQSDIAAVASKTERLAELLDEVARAQQTLQAEVGALRHEWAEFSEGPDGWQSQIARLGPQIGAMQWPLVQVGSAGAADVVRLEPANEDQSTPAIENHTSDWPIAQPEEAHAHGELADGRPQLEDPASTISEGGWRGGEFEVDSPTSSLSRSAATSDSDDNENDAWQPVVAGPLLDAATSNLENEHPFSEVSEPAAEFDWTAMTSKRPSTSIAGHDPAQHEQGGVDKLANSTSALSQAPVESEEIATDSIASSANPWSDSAAAFPSAASDWPVMDPADTARSLERCESQDEQIHGGFAQSEWQGTESTKSNVADQQHDIDDDLASFDEFSIWNRGATELPPRDDVIAAADTPAEAGDAWQSEVAPRATEDELEPPIDDHPNPRTSRPLIDEQPRRTTAVRNSQCRDSVPTAADTVNAVSVSSPQSTTSSFIEKYAHMFDDDGPTGEQDSSSRDGREFNTDESVRQRDEVSPAQRLAAAATADGGPSDDEESIEQYMAKLMQRVRGDSPVIAASQTRTAAPNRGHENASRHHQPAAPQATQQNAADSVESRSDAEDASASAGNSDSARRAIPLAEQAANLETFRALANESARRAIGKHASGVHRRDAVTKAIVATLAGMTSIWLMLDAPHWRDLQFISACVSLLVAAYWAGQTYGTLIDAFQAASYHGPQQAVHPAEDPFHPRLPIDVDRV